MTTIDAPLATAPGPAQRLAQLLMSQEELQPILKSAAQVLAIRLLGAGLTYASMVFLARWLGSHNFGIYAYVLVIVTLLGLGFSFGFSSSGLRFISSYLAQHKTRRLAGFLSQSHKIVLLVSMIGASAAAGVVFVLKNNIEPYYVVPLLVGLLCVPLWAVLNQLEATARAFGWFHVAYIPAYILRPSLLTAFVGLFLLLGGTPDAVTALWGLIGACAAAALAQGLLVYAKARKHVATVKPPFHTRHWFTISLGFLMIDAFRMLLDNTDILLIGRFLDPESVAVYFAVIRTCGLIGFLSFSVVALAVPRFAEIHSTGTREELQKFVTLALRLMFWPSLLAALAMAALGPVLLSMFGADFEMGYPTMLVVLAGLVLRSGTLPVEYLLNMTGHHRDTLQVYALAAFANIVLNLVLIPAFGIPGAAVGSYAAMLTGNLFLCRLVQKRLGIDACIFPFARFCTFTRP